MLPYTFFFTAKHLAEGFLKPKLLFGNSYSCTFLDCNLDNYISNFLMASA